MKALGRHGGGAGNGRARAGALSTPPPLPSHGRGTEKKKKKKKLVDIEPRFLFDGGAEAEDDATSRYPDYFTLTNYEVINDVESVRASRAHKIIWEARGGATRK